MHICMCWGLNGENRIPFLSRFSTNWVIDTGVKTNEHQHISILLMNLYLWPKLGFLIPSLHCLSHLSQILILGLPTQSRIDKGNTYLESCKGAWLLQKWRQREVVFTPASGRQAWASAGAYESWIWVECIHITGKEVQKREESEVCRCMLCV